MINLLIDNNLISLKNLKNNFFPPISAIYFCEKNNTHIPIKNDLNSGFIIPHFKIATRSQILKILFEGQLQTMETSLENIINRFKIKEKKDEILNSIPYGKLFKYEENIGTIIISNEDKKIKTNTLVGLSIMDIEIAEHYLEQINNKTDILQDSQHFLNKIGKVVNQEISEKLNDLQALINKNILKEQQPISQKKKKLKL